MKSMDSAANLPVSSTNEKPFYVEPSATNLVINYLNDKRSPSTRTNYARDLNDFFRFLTGATLSLELARWFLSLDRFEALSMVLSYRHHCYQKGLKESTVNRRLAAIKSLVNYARQVGQCDYDLADVKYDKIKQYRDTTGVDTETFRLMFKVCDRSTVKGKRDYALLRLLWSNALRREEVSSCNVQDFDSIGGVLWIQGKGQVNEKEKIELGQVTIDAIQDWLNVRENLQPDWPLFIALNSANKNKNKRLTGCGLYYVINTLSQQAGLPKQLSPHQVRHSSITAALDQTNGNVREVQKLSRHADINVLMTYDDNRQKSQGKVTRLLDNLI